MSRVPVGDVVLAVVAVATTAIEAGLVDRLGVTWYSVANVGIHVGLTATLLVRHVWRRWSFVATYLLLGTLAAVAWWSPANLGVSPLIACAPLSLYVVARHEPPAWGLVGLMLGVAGAFVSPLRRMPGAAGGGAWIPVMVLVLVGTFVWASGRRRTELAYGEQLAEEARRADARVVQARSDERALLARELHDIVGHSLAVVQVQASTALSIGGTQRHVDALTNIRDSSEAALSDIRAFLEAEREDPTTVVGGELSRLATLVRSARDAGVRLTADLPDQTSLDVWQAAWPSPVRLTVIRAVQELLTNVIRHGGPNPTAALRVAVAGEEVVVEVSNDHAAPAGRPGYGLVGLRERLELVGGTLTAGPDGDGFRGVARLPVGGGR